MVKREAVKQRLKAADRRRQRRNIDSRPVSEAVTRTDKPRVDVVGLIANAILRHAESLGSEARDVIVIAALNSTLRASTPSGDDAKRLAEQFSAISSQSDVSMKAFREALQQLLSTANQHHDPRQADAFLRYLSILSDT